MIKAIILGAALYGACSADAPQSPACADRVFAQCGVESLHRSERQDLADLHKGRVCLVVVWASYCPPCVKKLASVVDLKKVLCKEGVDVVVVSIDRTKDAAHDKVHSMGGAVKGVAQWWSADLASIMYRIGVQSIPCAFVVDASGELIKTIQPQGESWTDPSIVAEIKGCIRNEKQGKKTDPVL